MVRRIVGVLLLVMVVLAFVRGLYWQGLIILLFAALRVLPMWARKMSKPDEEIKLGMDETMDDPSRPRRNGI